MKSLINNMNLVDTFRYLYPKVKAYTHVGYNHNRPESRLDRIYISIPLLNKLQKSAILPSFSDHLIVNTCLTFTGGTRSAYWKFDNQLLQLDDFKEKVSDVLTEFLETTSKSFGTYELLKFNIKKVSMYYRMKELMRFKAHVNNISKLISKDPSNSASLFQDYVSGQSRGISANILNPDAQNFKIPDSLTELTIDRALEAKTTMEKSEMVSGFFRDSFRQV